MLNVKGTYNNDEETKSNLSENLKKPDLVGLKNTRNLRTN